MTFHWRLAPAESAPGQGTDPVGIDRERVENATFATQGDAETYLGEHWRAMAAAGVTDVTLVDEVTSVYEMSLLP